MYKMFNLLLVRQKNLGGGSNNLITHECDVSIYNLEILQKKKIMKYKLNINYVLGSFQGRELGSFIRVRMNII